MTSQKIFDLAYEENNEEGLVKVEEEQQSKMSLKELIDDFDRV